MTTTKTAVLYGRVSLDRDGESRSVDDQIATMRATVEQAGYRITHVLEDRGIGASAYSKKTRDGYAELVALIEGGTISAVGVFEISRLTRDMTEWVRLRDACERHGIVVITASGTIDFGNDGDRLSGGVLGLVAEAEARSTSKRVKRSRDASAAEGRPHGRTTYGYRRSYGETGRLASVEVVTEEADVLIAAARHVLRGAALVRFVTDLNAQGVPSPAEATAARTGRPVAPSPWTVTTLRRLLVSPTYAGLRIHRGAVVGEGAWPALWDADTHKRLVSVFDSRAVGTRQRVIKHWLSGVLICDQCKKPLRVNTSRGVSAYQCPCRAVSLSQPKVEQEVTGLIVRVVADGRMRRSEPSAVAELREGLALASERLAEASDAFARGTLGLAALAAVEARLAPVQAALAAELRKAELPATDVDPDEVLHRWGDLPADRKRSIARLVLGRITVIPSGHNRYVPVMARLKFPDLDLAAIRLDTEELPA